MGSAYDLERFSSFNDEDPESSISWFETTHDDEWSLKLSSVYLGTQELTQSYLNETSFRALIDTGTSKILMPLAEFITFRQEIENEAPDACNFNDLKKIICDP